MFSISIREMFSRCDKRFPRPSAERYSKSTDERLNSFLSISTHLIRPRVLNRWGEVGRKRGSRGCLSLLVFSWLWCLVPAEGLAQLLRIHTSMGWGEEGAWGLYLRSGASPRGTHGPSVPPVQCVPAPPQTCWRLLPCPTVRPSNLPQFLSPLCTATPELSTPLLRFLFWRPSCGVHRFSPGSRVTPTWSAPPSPLFFVAGGGSSDILHWRSLSFPQP